ncbi:MAG: NADH-quinone oxidoreductase subunit L [Verrucomicrobiia bacterium]|jgi:NADH-quinone oxidoreductase subunit L
MEQLQHLAAQQWLIPFFPLLAAAIQSLLKREQRKLSAGLAIGALSLSCFVALRAFWGTMDGGHGGEHHEVERAIWNFTWLKYGYNGSLDIGFILDPLTAGMAAMVTFVGLMIFINATGYMAEDENFTRFFCFMSLFAAAMLGLVVANNLLLFFICWELVGLCSYLLIGFWFFKPSAAAAMKKAFITTRIGDIGFFLGILTLYWQTGTLNLYDHGRGALEQADKLAQIGGWWIFSMAGLIAVLLFFGAMGKSAQFPLHVWLPDAMEGPTPVSALIHAATMVAAGVFMVGRMFPLFTAGAVEGGSTPALDFVMWIGCFTAVFSATIAVGQFDIKRVLAYSTCSQLGYMVMALGAGGLVAGQFHLLTHAFFKALLFLGAGSVIIGTHHEQDMRKMGGLRKYMPITFACYMVGMLALSGVPPFAGFFSKDEVLLVTYHRSKLAWGLATFAAFLTAFYMTRQICMVFFGKWRGGEREGEHEKEHEAKHEHEQEKEHEKQHEEDGHGHGDHEPHEIPWNMWMPIAVLSVFAVVLGFFGTPFIGGNLFHRYVAPGEYMPEGGTGTVMVLSIAVGALGILFGCLIYGRKPMEHADEPDPLAKPLGGLFTCLNRKWYIDELYEATIIRLTMACGVLFRLIDELVIDGILHTIVWLTRAISQFFRWVGDEFFINGGFDTACDSVRDSGGLLSRLQNGRVQNYFRVLSIGAAVLLVIYFLKLNQ